MQNIIQFLQSKDIEKNNLFLQLKCTKEEVTILQYITKQYIQGNDNLIVINILSEFYDIEKLQHLEKLSTIKNLLELGWIVQTNFNHIKLSEIAQLELINSNISLSSAFLKLLEDGSLDLVLPEATAYGDHLEYLQDQFFKISLALRSKALAVLSFFE